MASVLPLVLTALLLFTTIAQGYPAPREDCECFSENESCPEQWEEGENQNCGDKEHECCPPLKIFFFSYPNQFTTAMPYGGSMYVWDD